MFYDMALLVEEQGEMIDRIEHNVENAAVHVDIGRKEIRVAVQFQRKNRRVSTFFPFKYNYPIPSLRITVIIIKK